MPLYLDTGSRSPDGVHQDDGPCAVLVPDNRNDVAHGALLAIAHGIPERPAPGSAARDALKTLADSFGAAPEDWGLKHALYESFAAANRTVINVGEQGRATALSALAFRRRRWAIVHAGHTRIWLLRGNELKLLTRDHVTPRMRAASDVYRACGLTSKIEADLLSGEIAEGDVFLLTNPEAHRALTGAEIMACAIVDVSASQIAATIVDHAQRGARGTNARCAVVRVEQVPPESDQDIEEDIVALPAVAPPAVGDVVDDFRIERLVHKSSRFRLYKAVDTQNGQVVALKFPNPSDGNDPAFAERFLREEWIGRRVSSPHLVRTLGLAKGRRTVLYSAMAYPSSESLARRLARKGPLPLREVAFIGGQLLEALAQLHDQGVIHNDVRPQNIVIDAKSKRLMLLGLGSSHVTHTRTVEVESGSTSRRGSFLAPELVEQGAEPSVRSDIFAAAITLYRMLTGSYPYGKIASSANASHGEYMPLGQYRPELPRKVDDVMRRACALDPRERFESAQEFAEAFDDAVTKEVFHATALSESGATSTRTPWEIIAITAMVLALLIYLAFALKR